MNIDDPNIENKITPLFRAGFRPFFLGAMLYGFFHIAKWSALLSGVLIWNQQMPVQIWHVHEMMFGFAGAVIIGFLTTAAQTWTGQNGLKGRALSVIFSLWLLARFVAQVPLIEWSVFALDAAVLITVAISLATMIASSKNYRNLIFVLILIGLSLLSLSQGVFAWALDTGGATAIHHTLKWMMVLIIGVVGARVIPFFMERRLSRPFQRESLLFTILSQGAIVLITLSQIAEVTSWVSWVLLCVALICHLMRSIRWYSHVMWQEPLLWSLWLSYAYLPVAMCMLLADSELLNDAATHLIALGLMSGMILSMASRVTLGHTGRALHAHPIVIGCFAVIHTAAIVRAIGPLIFPGDSIGLILASAMLFCIALGLFLIRHIRFYLEARVDGRPG